MTDKSSDEKTLRAEIERLNRIIKALTDRAEQDMNTPLSDYGVFQATILLEDKVKTRTQELEIALQNNEKITRALQQAKKQIEESEHRLRDITSALGEGLLVLNDEAVIVFTNAEASNILGYTESEMLGKNAHELFHHSYPDGSPYPIQLCKMMNVIKTNKSYISEEEYLWRKNGVCFPVSIITTPIKLEEKTNGIVMAFHDVTQSVEERIRLREMQTAIEQSPASVIIVDKEKNIIYVNPEILKSTGYTKEELKNKKSLIFHGDQTPGGAYVELWNTVLSGVPWKGELLYRRKDGSTFWQSWIVAPVIDNHGEIRHFVGVGEDVTEKKKLQFLLQEMSYLDGLTGVANRRRFDDYFNQEWFRAIRNAQPLTVIMTDIDFFKRYNDRLGHLAGDDVLKRVADALKSTIHRATDLLARYGGEEFAFILPNTSLKNAKQLAEGIKQAVCDIKLFHPDSKVSKSVTMSIGVASCIPRPGDDPAMLLGAADAALYRAKTLGRNRVESD